MGVLCLCVSDVGVRMIISHRLELYCFDSDYRVRNIAYPTEGKIFRDSFSVPCVSDTK